MLLMRLVLSIALVAALPAFACEGPSTEAVLVKTASGPVLGTHYAVSSDAARPAVLVLHGDRGPQQVLVTLLGNRHQK